MSVLVLDPKQLNYIRAGIENAAYRNTVDEWYFAAINSHFRNRDIETEADRIIKSWADMNEKSYCLKYKDEFSSLSEFIRRDFTHKPLTVLQVLKYAECLYYNIEPEYWQLSEQEQKDLQLLKLTIESIKSACMGQIKEYKDASWSND